MKRTLVGMLVAMVMLVFGAAANALDTGACTDGRWTYPLGQTCEGLVEWFDMGDFVNGNFEWKDTFINEIEAWGTPLEDWQERWAPSKGFGVTQARFDLRRHVGGAADSRVTISGGEIVSSPYLWRVTGGLYGYFISPQNPNDPWIDLEFYWVLPPLTPLKAENISSFVWNGEPVAPCNNTYDAIFMRYSMGANWYEQIGSQTVTIDEPDIVSEPFPSIPDATGIQTVTVNLAESNPFSLPSFSLEFDAVSVDEMPVVPAFNEDYFITPTGRITKKTIDVQNITAKEDDDGNLIVQWGEPTIAQPGITLRIFVGYGWNAECVNNEIHQKYIFLDCPSQTGTVVVPVDQYQDLKNNPPEEGLPIGVAGMYRQQFQDQMENGWTTNFHNRGYFEWVPVEQNQ